MPKHTAGGFSYDDPDLKLPRKLRDYINNGAPEGERNSTLLWAACQYRDCGFSEADAHVVLGGRAEADGLGQDEWTATIRQAFKSPPREPPIVSAAGASNGQEPPKQPPKPPPAASLPQPMINGLVNLLREAFKHGEYVAISDGKLGEKGRCVPGPGTTLTRERW